MMQRISPLSGKNFNRHVSQMRVCRRIAAKKLDREHFPRKSADDYP